MKVVAEGVETKEQYELLKAADCDFMQGYYFSKPMDAAMFETFIISQPDFLIENIPTTNMA
jgi:EAL domain-containing protein (putative c-di-GMP-specific phosphodiesterase class I)